VKGLDGFGKELPAFNLRGETRITTVVGGLATLCVVVLTFSYAALKMIELAAGKNPTINDSKIDGFFATSETVNFNEINWNMAFSIENMESRDAINDPRYVKWIVRLYEKHGEVLSERLLPFHSCTAEDYEKFYPLS